MTLELALGILAAAALTIGVIIWAINIAEQKIRDMVRAGLEQPIWANESAARSRALDDEYRTLVLNAHNEDNL